MDKSHNVIQRFNFWSLSLKTYMMSGWNFLNFELSYGCDVLIFTVEKICIKSDNGKSLNSGQVGHAATAFWGFHGMKESYLSPLGDALACHSVHWAPGQEVWVQDLVRSMCCVLGKNNWLSPCLSQPRSINGYWWIVREAWWNAGG